ncbi:MAG: hypothetical protein Q7S78_00485 [Candidatus Azambacteria bacterium]|nr:hypothetical protein [Candidatus Azambacteria bacterium]
MDNSGSSKYISLKAAAELYGYTRDHLGLMIRQRKLNGVKLGSYYVTTGEWMTEYVKNFASLNHPTLKNKLSNRFFTGVLSAKRGFPAAIPNVPKISRDNTVQNAQIVKPAEEKTQKYDTDNTLKEIILEELSRYAGSSGADAPPGVEAGQLEPSIQTARAEYSSAIASDAPYVILPIRKMENAEREEVLRKVL